MSLTTEERQRLWLLFQACDTDSDGLVNNEDIRLLSSRSEFSDYNPGEIIDLFATFQNDDSNYTFEDFINKKLAHHERLSEMSETTSMSSGFTNRSTEDSIPDRFDKRLYRRSVNNYPQQPQQYDSNLNKYKTNLILDEIDSTLSKSMNNLQLESSLNNNNNYRRANMDDIIGQRVFTAIPPSIMDNLNNISVEKYRTNANNNREKNKFNDLKRYLKNYLQLPEGMERSDWSEDAKKKFDIIRQDYFNCLNELSDENENICEELDRTMKERNYLRDKIEMLRDEYQENLRKHREQWLCERQKLEQKINNLESYVAKLSYASKPNQDMSMLSTRYHGVGVINNNTADVINDNFNENFKLHQLANKISELALFLSEIISNLRKSEIDLMMANCRAAGIVKNVNHRSDDEDELIQIYERAMLNRNLIEQESIDFICNLDKEILIQYLTPTEFQKIFKNNRQLTFDMEFQNILLDLLVKLKDDLRNVNKTLDLQQQIDQESVKFRVDTYNNYLQDFSYKL